MVARKRKALLIVLMAAVVAAFFGDVLLGDRVLITSDTCRWLPWADYAAPPAISRETYRTDAARTYLPRRVQVKRSIASGDFPFWNPYILGGCPFFADPQTAVLYPSVLGLLPADPAKAMGYDVALHFFLAALGMFLFLGAIGADLPGRMVGALAYCFSSFFFLRIGHPTFVAAAAWLPYLFFAYERSRHSLRSGVLMLAVFLCLGYLAGMPQVFLFGVSALLLYVVVDVVEGLTRNDKADAWRSVRAVGPAAVIALLAVGVHLVPFIEYVENSRGLGFSFEAMTRDHLWPPVFLLRSIVPDLFGNPVDGTSWIGLVKGTVHPYNSGFMVYCGVAGLALALASCVFIRSSRHIRALLALLLLSVAAGTSALVLRIVYTVFPPATYSQIDRISVVACFAVAALAGKGIALATGSEDVRARRVFAAVPAGLAAVVASGLVFFRLRGMDLMSDLSAKAEGLAGEGWFETGGFRLLEWLDKGVHPWFSYEMTHIGYALFFACLSAALIYLYLGYRRHARLRRVWIWLLGVSLVLDLGLTARRYYVSQPPGCLAETEGIEILSEAVGKEAGWTIGGIGSLDSVRPPNTHQLDGVEAFGGLNALYPSSYAGRLGLAVELSRSGGSPSPVISPVGDLMCVRYLVTDAAKPELTLSPVVAAMAGSRDLAERLGIVEVGGERRLSLLQKPGEACSLYVGIPQCRYLDFSLALRGTGSGVRSEPPGAEIVLRGRGQEEVLLRSGPLYEAGRTWTDLRLDVSGLAGRSVALVLRATGMGAPATEIGWSGFDFVLEDCSISMTEGGYRIDVGQSAGALAMRVRGAAGEHSLRIERADGPGGYQSRFVRFAGPVRRTEVLVGGSDGPVLVRGAKEMEIVDARLVQTTEGAHLGLRPFYDGDMFIYENQAALPRGICVPRRVLGVSRPPGDFPGGLGIASALPDLMSRISGTTSVRVYEAGRVVMEASVDEACVLLLQDTWYPGWRAEVDGAETPLLRTDLGILAVPLEQGEHEVVMAYKPWSFKLGLGLSLLGISIGVLYGAKAKRR